MSKTIIPFILITAIFLIMSCNTAQVKTDRKEIPEWVANKYIVNSDDYFIGAAFLNDLDDTDDFNKTRQKAFSNLVSVIFENIKKSQKDLLPADAEKKYFAYAEAHIIQALTGNSASVKSDSHQSETARIWLSFRILKSDWERIKKEEKQEIADFIEGILSPRFLSRQTTTFELLTFLGNSWKFVAGSPYPKLVRGTINNERGLLLDLIEDNIATIFSGLAINIETNHIITEPGRPENFIISVLDSEGRNPGRFRINLYNRAAGGKVAEVITGINGRYSGKIEFKNLLPGEHQLYAEVSMPHIGINPQLLERRVTVPAKNFTAEINRISVVLKLVINGEVEIDFFLDRIKTLFTREELAIRLSPGNRGERYTVIFTLNFADPHINAHNLFIANANATLELLDGANKIFSYITPEYSEVGLDWNRAQERVAIKMFNDINRDELFFREFHRALYARVISE
ncbi:MAG: hypothetical protein FWC36_02260 [Spirochaetes bacterium]|nr:hypothetical protein [Spirochaetota bacterium]